MIYLVDELKVSEDRFNLDLEKAIDEDTERKWDDILDEMYPAVSVGCETFAASEIMRKLSPTTYRVWRCDESSARLSDKQNSFINAHTEYINSIEFRTADEKYQVWIMHYDKDGLLLDDCGCYIEEMDTLEDAKEYLRKLTMEEVKKFMLEQDRKVINGETYYAEIETVVDMGTDGDANVETADKKLFIF